MLIRIILALFIIFYSFSNSFALSATDEAISLGVYGYGYIPMETDKEPIGYGGGAGAKFVYHINNYFGIGLSTAFTAARSIYNNQPCITLFNDTRFLFIYHRETDIYESGFVPWGSIGLGILTGRGNYEDGNKLEDAIGFDIV